MNKLTLSILFLIFLGTGASSAKTEEKALEPMDDQVLLGRSYQPKLAYHILRRSTGRTHRIPLSEGQIPDKTVPDRSIQQPMPRPVSPPPDREHTPPLPTSGELHPQVLNRLRQYDNHIERYSRMNRVDPNLIRALIYVESSGNPRAVSPEGAQGLMQLMPATASDMGVSNPFDPAQNIFGGARYISRLLARFERLDLALWAYNAGPEAVARKRLPLETKRFIPEVVRIKSILDRRES